MARLLSLPADADSFTSPLVDSFRIPQGVLHNPRSDRRTTQGIFHIAGDSRPVGARHDLGGVGFGRLAQVRPGSEQLIQHGGFLRRGQGVQR